MNAHTMEMVLTRIFATALELEIDVSIFRGVLPDGVRNGVGVIVEAFANGNYPGGCNEISFQLLGRFENRQDAMELSRKADQWLPRYSPALRLTKSGSVAVYESSFAGRKVFEISCNGKAIFPQH